MRLDCAALSLLPQIEVAIAHLQGEQAGVRIFGNTRLAALLGLNSAIGQSLLPLLSKTARPVRAIVFDKSAATNWALGWHQDRTIAVRKQIDTAEFGPWSRKGGIVHVEPPFDMIEQMITIRIHFDKVCEENAPLLVAIGSHRLGKIPVDQIEEAVAASTVGICTAERGDIWVYATPIVHASARSGTETHRRVLQIDYADFDLPNGLAWSGI